MLALEQATEIENPQARIRDLAERCLRRNPYLAIHKISCDYGDGALVLRGFLPTYYLKQVAQEAVAQLEEVGTIHNWIEVLTPPLQSRRS